MLRPDGTCVVCEREGGPHASYSAELTPRRKGGLGKPLALLLMGASFVAGASWWLARTSVEAEPRSAHVVATDSLAPDLENAAPNAPLRTPAPATSPEDEAAAEPRVNPLLEVQRRAQEAGALGAAPSGTPEAPSPALPTSPEEPLPTSAE